MRALFSAAVAEATSSVRHRKNCGSGKKKVSQGCRKGGGQRRGKVDIGESICHYYCIDNGEKEGIRGCFKALQLSLFLHLLFGIFSSSLLGFARDKMLEFSPVFFLNKSFSYLYW